MCICLFCSIAALDPRVGHSVDVLSPFISAILIDSSTLYVLMLFIQSIRGLPRLLALAVVSCKVALSLSPANCLVSSWCDHSMLASLL